MVDFESIFLGQPELPIWVIVLALAWSVPWKGVALWKSARNGSPFWFVLLLIVNTLGILEILYIFLFSKIDLPEVKEKSSKKRSKKN